MKIELYLLSNFKKIHDEYLRLKDQMKNTCGPYTLLYILRGLGFCTHNDIPITEDYLAMIARTRIDIKDKKLREEIMDKLLKGELSLSSLEKSYREILYRYELIPTTNPIELDTSPKGIKYACELITKGELVTVPIPSRRKERILFTEDKFRRLTELLISKIDEWNYQAILNLQTSHLINNINPFYDIFIALLSSKPTEEIGLNPQNTGHFLGLAGFAKVYRDSDVSIYYMLRDTYKGIGYRGYHFQPLESVRKALVRDDGREGGILIIVRKDKVDDVHRAIEGLDLEIGLWDNGSPF